MIRLAVPGAAGRMGKMVVEAALARPGHVTLVAALARPGSPLFGTEAAPGVTIGSDPIAALARVDVYVDFTAADATRKLVELAAEHNVAAVIGTTSLTPEARAAIMRAAARVPIVLSPNFSLGVNLLVELVEKAARVLGEDYDCEVVEIHHRLKKDAPSGTAIAIAQAMARGRDAALDDVKRYSREGDVGARPEGEIGVVAVRGGDVVGEHTAHFLGPNERLEITHRAGSRAIFARGAVRAAEWVVGKPPGVYAMKDVLGL